MQPGSPSVSMPGATRPEGQVTAGSSPFASTYADAKPAAVMRP